MSMTMKNVVPKHALHRGLLFLPDCALALLLSVAILASYCKYLSDTCPDTTIYTPDGFPCRATFHRQAAWLLRRPGLLFRLSDNPLHRCWRLVTAAAISVSWLIYVLLRGRSASHYGAGHRTAFLSALRFLPKAAVLLQLFLSGEPSSPLSWYCQVEHGMVKWQHGGIALFFALNASEDHQAAYLLTSLINTLTVVAISWCMAAHGHATWSLRYLSSVAVVYMGIPLLASAFMALRKCRCCWMREGLGLGGGSAAGASAASAVGPPAAEAPTGTLAASPFCIRGADKGGFMLQQQPGLDADEALVGVVSDSGCCSEPNSADEREQSEQAIFPAECTPMPTARACSPDSVGAAGPSEAARRRALGGGGAAGAADSSEAALSIPHRLAQPQRHSCKPMYSSTIRHVRVVVKVGGPHHGATHHLP